MTPHPPSTMNTRMIKTLLASIAICAGFGTNLAAAASFDCAQTGSAIEKSICDNPKLSRLDEQLADLYRATVESEPAVKQQQIGWLRDVRDRCGDDACLTSAYEQRINALLSDTVAAPAAAVAAPSATPEPVPAESNPLALMIDISYFYGISLSRLDDVMSNPQQELFGKMIKDWSDPDFALLERKLKQQVDIERQSATLRQEKIKAMGYQAKSFEDDHDYSFRKGVIDKLLAAMPKYKHLAGLAREKHAADGARNEAEQQQQAALKVEQEQVSAAAAELREVEQAERQVEQGRTNNVFVIGAIIAALLGGFIWHKFIRLRCPRCKSTSVDTLSVERLERWQGTKKVSERNSRGTNTRHVSTTYVRNRYHYQCSDCGEEWSKAKKEEL